MAKQPGNRDIEKGVLYCTVRWSNHNNNVNQYLMTSYAGEKYTDVAIACQGQIIKAHKMVLAGCSPYFETLFNNYDHKIGAIGHHSCIVVDDLDIAYPTLQLILEFMYSGEIRVKKSELDALVKGGYKLKVKGLDAVKLGDQAKVQDKSNEGRTVVGRSEVKPQPQQQQAVKMVTAARPAVPPAADKVRKRVEAPVKAPARRPAQPPSAAKPPTPEPPHPATPPKTVRPNETAETPGKSPQKETVVASPVRTTTPVKKAPVPVPEEPGPASTVKSAEEPVEQDSTRTRRTRNAVASNPKPDSSESSDPPVTKSPSSEPPVTEPDELPEAHDPNEAEPAETSSKSDDAEENGEAEAEPVSKRRIIKKPARLADMDFVTSQEIKIPPMKKRRVRDSPNRKQVPEENAESTPAEEPAQPAEPAKKRTKGVFAIFCQEFREKMQAENPGETHGEITKRLSAMWKNLDPTEKEKFCHPPKAKK